MRFSQLISAIPLLSLTNAIPNRRQTPTTAATLYSFPNTTWISGSTTTSNGTLLLSLLNVPELWSLDPSTKKVTHLLTHPNVTSGTGIVEIAPSVFLSVTGNFSTSALSFTPGSWGVWKIDLSGPAPVSTLLKTAPDSGFWVGITKFDAQTVLIADAGKGAIIKMDSRTGDYSTLIADPAMKAPSNALIQEGIHGIKYRDGWVYFSNTFGGSFGKVQVDPVTGKVAGNVTTILSGLTGPEDFVFGADGKAYLAELSSGDVLGVSVDVGKSVKFANASSCATVSFGRGAKDNSTLYISTSNGVVFEAQVA